MSWLPISHLRQQQRADCLAACAAMVLTYWGVRHHYAALLQLLRIRDYGAAFSNLRLLVQLGVQVEVASRDLAWLRRQLQNDLPVIVFLNTGLLTYWTEETGHAVVVIGMDEQSVVVHDPYLSTPAHTIPVIEFEAAWIEQDQLCAVLRPA